MTEKKDLIERKVGVPTGDNPAGCCSVEAENFRGLAGHPNFFIAGKLGTPDSSQNLIAVTFAAFSPSRWKALTGSVPARVVRMQGRAGEAEEQGE